MISSLFIFMLMISFILALLILFWINLNFKWWMSLRCQIRVYYIISLSWSISRWKRKYARDILSKFGMLASKPAATPMNINEKLQQQDRAESADTRRFRSLVGGSGWVALEGLCAWNYYSCIHWSGWNRYYSPALCRHTFIFCQAYVEEANQIKATSLCTALIQVKNWYAKVRYNF